VDIFVVIRELVPEFVGGAFNFLRPPSTNILDGLEGFLRSLVYRKGRGEVLIRHDFLQFSQIAVWDCGVSVNPDRKVLFDEPTSE
jgi:hypothetical protein